MTSMVVYRLQELEDQYRKEREETHNLLEQQRMVRHINKWTRSPKYYQFVNTWSVSLNYIKSELFSS